MGRSKAQPRHALAHQRQTFKVSTAFVVLIALLLAMAATVIPSQSASATSGGGGSTPQCTTEFEWVKKGTEYRWKTVYKEAKQLKGWFVELPNTWTQGEPNTWYDLPAEKQPPRSDQVAPTGTVPLSVYGGPQGVNTQYKYKSSFTEFFPSETGFSAGPPPTGKDWGKPVARQSVVVDGPRWAATSPGDEWEKTSTPSRQVNCPPPFDWNWQYAAPTCDGLSVVYPSNIPAGSDNKDVNIRVKDLTTGTVKTFNFHDSNFDTKGKTVVYDVRQHPDWPGWSWYEVQWTQVHGTNYHWQGSATCGTQSTPKIALASFAVSTQATCTATSQSEFSIENATWDSDAVLTAGTHTRTATANDGHQFANGSTTATVTYTVDDMKPEQSTDPSADCYVATTPLSSNPTYKVVPICGAVTFNFTNPVELGEGQRAGDAVFTYTDEKGQTQTVSVSPNGLETRIVSFAEDSGDHVVTVGLEGEEQETITVPTDCVPNPTTFTPTNPTFVDQCTMASDSVNVPGTLVWSDANTDALTGVNYRYEEYQTDTGSYYPYYEQTDNTLTVEIWFGPKNPNATPIAPGANDTYTIEFEMAVWRYSFTNEACATTTPIPTPPAVTPATPTTPTTPAPPALTPALVPGLTPVAVPVSAPLRTPVLPSTPKVRVPVKTVAKPSGDPKLAATGTDPLPFAAGFIGLLLIGSGLVAASRRRMHGTDTDSEL